MSLASASVASMAAAAVGSLVQGVSQAAQAKRAAGIADANADVAERQGQAEAELVRERARRLRGTNVANIGASGVDITGSFADALSDNDISSELDAQNAIWTAKNQAKNFRAQGGADRSSADASLLGGVFGAGTQALQGYGNWRLLKTMQPGATTATTPGASIYGGQAARAGF